MFAGVAGASASADGSASDPVSNVAPAGSVQAMAKMSHSAAKAELDAAGIGISSSGGCSDRQTPTCTSLEQVNSASIAGAKTLKSASGCGLTVTGGTEVGHASGTYSHYNGYKLDFSMSSCLTNYITGNFTSIGGSKWEAPSGNVYFNESNHWDVTFYNSGS
ncbi:hypothetical protein CFN78_14180 [Amycolatopsis antarctica]|uniref:Peptidoglycan-binding protein n=2 Tax=Amycolatopsis antarctica TaxID=1854586 RepID=A0A263D625_9PSEU|nr:hypothetical protein CFN78_14180 [Amycolatopsis antarctica]